MKLIRINSHVINLDNVAYIELEHRGYTEVCLVIHFIIPDHREGGSCSFYFYEDEAESLRGYLRSLVPNITES